MEKGPEQQRLSPTERGNLVAYLDGELREHESCAIATKLTQSPTARREVEALEKTWELLEHLPRPKVRDDFAARTLTEVQKLAEEGTRFEAMAGRIGKRAAGAAIAMAAALAAFGIGFLITNWAWPNPTARLVRDLPIAEHLDEYREVGSFDFLEGLVNSPEFNADRD